MREEQRSIHHRRCRSNGGDSRVTNLSNVSLKQHLAWHTLFGNRKPQDIADYINAVWLDPRYKFVVCVKTTDGANPQTLTPLGTPFEM